MRESYRGYELYREYSVFLHVVPRTPSEKKNVMSRIKKIFETKRKNVLNVYCTAGYPQLDSTLEVMKALQENGADIIELGMPYSDPLADGPVIQQSGSTALANGMTINKLFEQLKDFRKDRKSVV